MMDDRTAHNPASPGIQDRYQLLPDSSGRWSANPEVVAERLGDALVLIHLGSDRIFELNDSAARLYEMIVQGLGTAEIENGLAEEFEVPAEDLRQQIAATLAALQAEKLVVANRG